MIAETIFIENLNFRLKKSNPTEEDIALCCKDILDYFKFDCVFIAFSPTPEGIPVKVALDGNEEIMDICLYRLGVEERISLLKLPLKAYTDMTGKPIFNKSGSLRIQKPNSGVFMAHCESRKNYILFGCANQNSQVYDQQLLDALTVVWRKWFETLEIAVLHLVSPGNSVKVVKEVSEPSIPSEPPIKLKEALSSTKSLEKDMARRPVILVDEVTRLYNKEYFNECLSIEVERAKRYSRLMSLMFLSVTRINSDSDHDYDENIIANQVAEILCKSLRRVDVICRLDKDMYGIILPDTANNTYGIIAKRIFKFFKQIMGDKPQVYLNVSASTFPRHAQDHHALFDNVEKLLIQAQAAGPNKAVLPD